VLGEIYWGWLYIDLMWIKEECRDLGYGQRLLKMTKGKARQLSAKNAYLDTFSFQAPDTYKKFGYQIFGELKDIPPGQQCHFLTK
jgi:N-acetylglutamate synthase-like GNAT family acetyltransferase